MTAAGRAGGAQQRVANAAAAMRVPYGQTVHGEAEIEAVVRVLRTSTQMGGHVREFAVEKDRVCLLNPKSVAEVAFERVLEVAIKKDQINLEGQLRLKLGVALWHGGLPVDVLPAEGFLDVDLGEETSSWPLK